MAFKLIKLPQVLEMTAISRSTLDRLEAAGDFPKRVSLIGRRVAWYESEINDWINERTHKNKED